MSSYQHMHQGSPTPKRAAFKTPNINQPASDSPLSYPPQRIVANVAPRSSSLPLTRHPMGSSPSKPDPPSPTTSTGATVKGIGAAVAGGIKHTLAFGTRRKKSEDASTTMNAVASQGPGQELESTRNPEVPKKSPPQQVHDISQSNLAPHSPPLPPLPPQKEPLDPAPLPSVGNRTSMMVVIPGTSNAVNFVIERAPSPAPLPAPLAPIISSSPPSHLKESWRKSDSTNSHHTIRPGAARGSRPVSWAESFQSAYTVVPGSGSSSGHGTGNKRRSVLADDADFGMREEEGDYENSSHGHERGWSNRSSMGFSSTSSHSIVNDSPPHRPRSRSNNRRSISVTVGSSGAYSPSPSSSHRHSPPPPNSASAKEMKKASYSFSEGVRLAHPQVVPQPTSSRAPSGMPVTRTGQGQERYAAPAPIPAPTATTGLRSRFAAWTGAGSPAEIERTPSPSNAKVVQRIIAPPVAASASRASILNARQERGLPSLPPTSVAEVPFQGLFQHQQGQGQGYPMPLSSSPSQAHTQPHPYPQGHAHHVVRPPAVSLTPSGFGPAAASLAKRTAEKVSRKLALALSSSGSPSHPNNSQEGLNSSPSIGSGYSSSSTTTTMSSGFSFGGGLVRTSSNTSAPSVGSSSGQHHGHGHSHSHQQGHVQQLLGRHGAVGAFMHTASKSIAAHRSNLSTSSTGAGAGTAGGGTSDSDGYYEQPQGPMLGVPLRGVLRTKNGVPFSGGGVVFGRDLRGCVRDTGIRAGKATKGDVRQSERAARQRDWEGEGKGALVKELEERELPALVVRCAQHLLIWGVQEEGLFRVSGRPSHTTSLRAEFDAGVDYDMTACSPGDLDPHSVASVFKAYLRELPEPILTQRLQHHFDAAVKQETLLHANDPPASPQRMSMRPLGGGLPPNPKLGFEAMRKRPSLSTLATPSFLDVPPASRSLVLTLRGLIAQLPQENRDLLRTVVDLIQATARRSKQTKMPLGNLLVVFCPSLQMSPPLLKVLSEAEGIWGEDVLDISVSAFRKREKANEDGEDIPPPTPTKDEEGDNYSDAQSWVEEDVYGDGNISSGRASLDPSSDYHASVSASEESDSMFDVHRRPRWEEGERSEIPTVYLDSLSHCSSSRSSVALSVPDDVPEPAPPAKAFHLRDFATDSRSISSGGHSIKMPLSSPPSSPPLSSSAESVTTPTSSNPSYSQLHLVEDKEREKPGIPLQGRQGRHPVIVDSTPLELKNKRPVISNPIPVAEPVQFPVSNHKPPTTGSGLAKRRSIPILSLPSFSTPVRPSSPADNGSPANSSPRSVASGLKTKKPSLKLLFSKRSTSSLSDKSGCGMPFISAPMPPPTQYQLKEDSMYLMTPKSSSASDSSSSISTPLSAVTAPQSTTSSMSSMSRLPPVLDTPIEGPSLSLELERFDVSPPDTAEVGVHQERPSETETLDPVASPASVKTPVARQYQPRGDRPPRLPASSPRSPDEVSLRSQMSTISLLSTSSSNHLNMFEEEDQEEEDWASCVLMAAEAGAESSETAMSASSTSLPRS